MKKSSKGEVVLSASQVQATRLNKLEYRRLQNQVNFLREDLQTHISRIHRQEQGLRYHFANVVRVIKPNRAFQLWKQAHAHEFAQDEQRDIRESTKITLKSQRQTRPLTASVLSDVPSEPFRPLLLLLADHNEKATDPVINFAENLLQTRTTSAHQQTSTQRRIDPILNMLNGRPLTSNPISRQQQPFESPSFQSLSSIGTGSPRKLVQGNFVTTHKASNLDALYRMALQNQTAYKSVDRTRIDERKLYDKEFASQHRALRGSMRSAGFAN